MKIMTERRLWRGRVQGNRKKERDRQTNEGEKKEEKREVGRLSK